MKELKLVQDRIWLSTESVEVVHVKQQDRHQFGEGNTVVGRRSIEESDECRQAPLSDREVRLVQEETCWG